MNGKKNQSYHHGSLRDALLTEAATILKKESLSNLSIRQLAKKCGVSCTALYRHFPNKDALVIAVLQRDYELLLRHLNHIVEQHSGDIIETLKAMGRGYVNFAQKHQNFFYIMYGGNSFLENKPYLSGKLNEMANSVYQLLESLIERGIQDKAIINDNPSIIAFSVWSYLHGIIFLTLQGKIKNITDAVVDASVDSATSILMGYLCTGIKPAQKNHVYHKFESGPGFDVTFD